MDINHITLTRNSSRIKYFARINSGDSPGSNTAKCDGKKDSRQNESEFFVLIRIKVNLPSGGVW